jgi:hypothetical protein
VRNDVDCFDIRLALGAGADFPAKAGRDFYFYVFGGLIEAGGKSFREGEQGLLLGGGAPPLIARTASIAVAFLIDTGARIAKLDTVGDHRKIPPAFAVRILKHFPQLRNLRACN